MLLSGSHTCSSMAKEGDAAKAAEETMAKQRQDQDGYSPKEMST
ncbi:hypothetical protein L195_g040219 [Trifolium pratense]|uniref:Uncharacterized protein n=1 Tax=Trifolium pratense TaxID=57577 RepID=A0A2K3M051_TRIPR|nr:hypothetical protein L195_g040219 [Trifolium pratense]